MKGWITLLVSVCATSFTWGQDPPQGNINFVVELDEQSIQSLREGKTLESMIPVELRGKVDVIKIRYKFGQLPPEQGNSNGPNRPAGQSQSWQSSSPFSPNRAGNQAPRVDSNVLAGNSRLGTAAEPASQPPAAPNLLPDRGFNPAPMPFPWGQPPVASRPRDGSASILPADRIDTTPTTGFDPYARSAEAPGSRPGTGFSQTPSSQPVNGASRPQAAEQPFSSWGGPGSATEPVVGPIGGASPNPQWRTETFPGQPRQQDLAGHTLPAIPSGTAPSMAPDRSIRLANNMSEADGAGFPARASGPQILAGGAISAEGSQSSVVPSSRGSSLLLWLTVFASLGLNIYLGWISRGFYLRYCELAEDLRSSFASA